MKESIKIFENARFGQIRTSISANDEPLFCLVDVCNALELKTPSKVKQRLNAKGVNSIHTLTNGETQQLTFITGPNLYKCIFQSRKKEAEQFQDWVTSEVLPSIRKSLGYIATQPSETPEQIMAKALKIADDKKLSKSTDMGFLIFRTVRNNRKNCSIRLIFYTIFPNQDNRLSLLRRKTLPLHPNIATYFHLGQRKQFIFYQDKGNPLWWRHGNCPQPHTPSVCCDVHTYGGFLFIIKFYSL